MLVPGVNRAYFRLRKLVNFITRVLNISKGSLARRLAAECPSKIELALQHTTASYHYDGHYKHISRTKFDDMLLAGEFLTYSEFNGESYGLSKLLFLFSFRILSMHATLY